MKHRIGISGSYGGMNLGDEAILASLLRELRGSVEADVVVFSANAKDTSARHHVRAVSLPEMDRDAVMHELGQLDLFVVGGGGLLFDGKVEPVLRDVKWARSLGVPVMIYAISAGPLEKPESKQLVQETLDDVQAITVRDTEAKKMLHDIGVKADITVTADPALLLEPEPFTDEMRQSEGIPPDVRLVGFSVREPGPAAPDLDVDHYHAVLANAADFMIDRFDASILFVPMEPGDKRDPQHSHAVISKMTHVRRATVLKGDYDSAQILGLVSQMDLIVGMRLHLLIFAAISHVPFVPLPYAAKVSGLLADLELPMPPLPDLNTGTLCAFIDRSWDTRRTIEKRLEERVPPLQERARETNRILVDLLEKVGKRR